MWGDLFIGIRTYHGEDDGATLTDDVDLAICTIEKANSIFNHLLDIKEEYRIHMVVVDELHLISDDKRGFLLEVLLSKILYTLGNSVQIVAMSATLPNVSDLSSWIHGSLYITQYRPVNLEIRISIGAKLYKINSNNNQLEFDRQINRLQQVNNCQQSILTDEDGFLSLCVETLQLKKSLLIFCSSKKRCEACVTRIADVIQSGVIIEESDNWNSYDHGNRLILHERRLSLMNQLRQTSVGICPLLRKTILYGVAYHHAGLTVEERKVRCILTFL